MKRKFLSLVLALVMVLGTFSAVFAETTPLTSNESKIQWLVDNEVVVGRKVNENDANDLALDSKITRAEVSKLLVYTLGEEKLADVLKGAIKVFPDVDLDHWANGYISVLATSRADVANGRRVIIGYEDGYFRPNNDVTYAELSTMLVRIVKKDLTAEMEKNAIWATSYIRWAQELGILDGIKLVDSDAPAVRRDAFVMIYNAMHKLNLVGNNKVDWGIKTGIVSKLQAGKIELNQDKDQTYNLTYDTVVTNATNWAEVSVNTVVPGSLVRLIADENGNVSHLLVVSVPALGYESAKTIIPADSNAFFGSYTGFHIVNGGRLFDLGKSVANGYINFTSDYRPYANVVVYETQDATSGTAIELNGNEKVYVADPQNNALKEVKSVAEAVKIYAPNANKVKGFVIYNTYTRYNGDPYNEGTVVVFTQVDKYHGNSEVLRVKYTPNSLKQVELQDTKGAVEIRDLTTLPFLPVSYNLHSMDVVALRYPIGSTANSLPNIRISYAEDPIYEVVKVGARHVELIDAAHRVARFDKPAGTLVFLQGELAPGRFVQIDRDATQDNVKIISVVDAHARRGYFNLNNLLDKGLNTGWLISVQEAEIQTGFRTLTFATKKLPNGEYDPNSYVKVLLEKTAVLDPKPGHPNADANGFMVGREYEFRFAGVWQGKYQIIHDLKDLNEIAWVRVNQKLQQVDATVVVTATDLQTRYDRIKSVIEGYNTMNDNMKRYIRPEAGKEFSAVLGRAKINAEVKAINDYLAANPTTGFEPLTPVK